MGMTFKQMQDRALALGNYGESDRANMILFINITKRDIEGRSGKWPWLRTSGTLTTVPGTREVAVPVTMKEHGELVTTSTDSPAPQWVNLPSFNPLGEDLSYNDDDSLGRPQRYTISAGAFVFDPVPDAIYTYKHIYEGYSADLAADGDTSSIPDGHEDVLIYGALMHYSARDKDFQAAAFWQDMFEGKLNKLSTMAVFDQNSKVNKVPMPAHYYGGFDY